MTAEQLGPEQANSESKKRVRRACHPCQIRKRRCDGNEPCSVCTRLEDTCYYETAQRKRRKRTEPPASRRPSSAVAQGPSPEGLQANSAERLQSRLEEKLAPGFSAKGVSAWNLGVSQTPSNYGMSIDSLLKYKELQALSDAFFRKFNPISGFLHEDRYYEALNERTWLVTYDVADPVFFGIALIGSYFQAGGANELQGRLYEALDAQLAGYSTAERPTLENGAALLLKTLYLRLTGSAYATWRTSCETCHTLEAIPAAQVCPAYVDRDKLYWETHMTQFAISYESGRPCMKLFSADSVQSAPARFREWDMFRLFEVFYTLAPDGDIESSELEDSIKTLAEMEVSEDAARLCQVNLTFSFFRRLRLQTESVPLGTLLRVLDTGTMGLAAARRLVEKREPWWQLATVPSQYLCAILVIDCPISLSRIRDALKTMEAIATAFPSDTTTNVLAKAQTMVSMLRERKRDEVGILDRSLADDDNQGLTDGNTDGHVVNGHLILDNNPVWGNLDWFTFDESMLPMLDFNGVNGTDGQYS